MRIASSGGFGMPGDSGITRLPSDVNNGVCDECEGRPARYEVRRPGESASRRLCFECLTEQLGPHVPLNSAALQEQARLEEEASLQDAERTLSPTELGSRAEFLEDWWHHVDEPMPAFIRDFIERHRGSAPPPATPVMGASVTEGDMQAARLALLVMRGALCERRPVGGDQYLIEPSTSAISRDEAAELLARMPKPLDCHARALGDVMVVRCRTITDPSLLRARADDSATADEPGDDQPAGPVFCLGYQESLVVSDEDVGRWHRDYELHPLGANSSKPGFYLASNPDAARAAVAVGAAYMMKCHFSPTDWQAEEDGSVVEVREPPAWDDPIVYALSDSTEFTCEHCGERTATWRATDTRTTPWRERWLCEVCTAEELVPRALEDAERFERWIASLSEKGRRSVTEDAAKALARMERPWRRLAPPAVVASALARCRGL